MSVTAITDKKSPKFLSMLHIIRFSFFLYVFIGLNACVSPPTFPAETACEKAIFRGIFVLNEGAGGNDASIYYKNENTNEICTELFEKVNSQPLGNIANDLFQNKDTVYIVMDNSQCVYKIQLPTWKLLGTLKLPDQSSPRHIYRVSDTIAYLSSLYQEKAFCVQSSKNGIDGRNSFASFSRWHQWL